MDDLLRESEKHKRQMSHNQKVILGSMTEIGTLGENTERSPGHIIMSIQKFVHLNSFHPAVEIQTNKFLNRHPFLPNS